MYGVYISQLVRYSSRACANHIDILNRGKMLKKKLSQRSNLHLGRGHHYETYFVVITNWLIATKYPFLKRQCFYLLLYLFYSITDKKRVNFMSKSAGAIRNRNCLPFASTSFHPSGHVVSSMLLIVLVF